MSIWIGYEHLDRLITYPEVRNLSGSAQPIRKCVTYPEVHNLSGSAQPIRKCATYPRE